MWEWITKHKKLTLLGIVLLCVFFIFLVPLILNNLYYQKAPYDFLKVGYGINDILGYYSAVLTFVGTISLGGITVYQNYKSQEKTEEINRLTLELQKKSMALAEQDYKRKEMLEEEKNTPKFELKSQGCNGRYSNLQGYLKNISVTIVSEIKSISFDVIDSNGTTIISCTSSRSRATSLESGAESYIDFKNPELISDEKEVKYGNTYYKSLKDVDLIWKFQCTNQYSKMFYYKASVHIEDSDEFKGDSWRVERIG